MKKLIYEQGQGTIPRPLGTEKQGQGTIPRPLGTEKQGQGTPVSKGTQKLEYLGCVANSKLKDGQYLDTKFKGINIPNVGIFNFYAKNKYGKYIVSTNVGDPKNIKTKLFEYKCNNRGYIEFYNGSTIQLHPENLLLFITKNDGEQQIFYQNGKLFTKGKYINGKEEGYREYFDDNGKLKVKGNYINGRQDGYWEYYDDNDKLKLKGNYINGKEDGYWVEKNGNNYEIKFYKDGEYIKTYKTLKDETEAKGVNIEELNKNKDTSKNTSKNTSNQDTSKNTSNQDTSKNTSNQDTSNKNQLKYYKCNDFPFTYGCVNSKISEIQTILNVTPNKGYFGPKTLKALNSKLDKKDIEELRKNGITQNIFNKIVSTVPKQSTTTEPKQSTTTEPKQSTTKPVSTTEPKQSTTTEPVLKDVVTKQEKPEGYNGLNDKLKNRYDERQSKIDQLNNIDNLTRKQKRILNRLNTKQKALLDKGKENLEKNLQESIKKEIDLINEMFIKINKNYFR